MAPSQIGSLQSSPFLETIQRRPQAQIAAKPNASAPGSEANSRLNTMTTDPQSRANSMKITDKEKAEVKKAPKDLPPAIKGKAGDIPLESFQRGAFNS